MASKRKKRALKAFRERRNLEKLVREVGNDPQIRMARLAAQLGFHTLTLGTRHGQTKQSD